MNHKKVGAGGGGGDTARQSMDGLWTEARGQQKQSNDPGNNQHHPQYTNYWPPVTRKRHTMPHPAQPWHTNHWAPRTRKRHQQEHRPQRPTESSDLTQHAKGRTGDCPGPRKGATTRRNVTQGGGAHFLGNCPKLELPKKVVEHSDSARWQSWLVGCPWFTRSGGREQGAPLLSERQARTQGYPQNGTPTHNILPLFGLRTVHRLGPASCLWGAPCPRCAKSRLFSTTASHGSQGPEFGTPDAVLNGSCTLLWVGGFQEVFPG